MTIREDRVSKPFDRQMFLTHSGNQQRPGIIIGAIAMDAIRYVMVGMLQHAGIIGKGVEVVDLDLRELEPRDGLDLFNIGHAWVGGYRVRFLTNFAENLKVLSGYLFPNRVTTKCISFFANGVPLDIVIQQAR